MANKKSATKADNLKRCVNCESEMTSDNFYKHRNPLLSSRVSLCKNCAIREASISIEKTHEVLRMLDMPFIPELYKECEGKVNPFSFYLTLINNPKKKYIDGRNYTELRYCDSPTLTQITDVDKFIMHENKDMGELFELFGTVWSKDELYAMNNELEKMLIQYGGSRDDLGVLDTYSEIIRTKWLSMRAYNNNDAKTGRELSETRQKLLKANGLTLQDIKDKSQNESLGVKIDLAEDRPIIPSKKYYDIDGINFMWEKFIKHMQRFFKIDKSSIEEDYEEMQEYVDTHEHYTEDME